MKDNFVAEEGINYKYITDIKFHKGVDEHGYAVIKCVAEDENAQNVLNLSAEAVWVNIKIGEKEGGPADQCRQLKPTLPPILAYIFTRI